jgi:uncharacterized membrane protein
MDWLCHQSNEKKTLKKVMKSEIKIRDTLIVKCLIFETSFFAEGIK